MRIPRLVSLFPALALVLATACGPELAGDRALDNDPPLASRDDLFLGAPKADEIPREFKGDEVLPAVFSDLVALQSPVKSQGSRGVCSIFSSTGLMEHLYVAAGLDGTPDFSEQYLQWSVKNQVGAFRNTSGSNDDSNLRAIVRFGVPEESAWPFEDTQWNEFNDPDCAPDDNGEDNNLATKCYTNGDPPEEATRAAKFHLPASRFLNRFDLKSHMLNRKLAAVVGLDFFYQSWNHRKSTLPTNSEYWDQGYVLYPNHADREISLEKRAGHAVLLVGWDDELELPIVDENGELVRDADGVPQTEKGFYIFKNSWGTSGFGIDNPFGPGYGYISQRYVHEFGNIRVADKPDIARATEDCGDGMDNDGNGDSDCDDAACAAAPECSDQVEEVVVTGQGGMAIPDNDPSGVSSPATASVGGTIRRLTLNVDIGHPFRSDLRVSLHKGSKAVVLHDRTGGSAQDLVESFAVSGFEGDELAGEWRLVVVDLGSSDVGTLRSWSLAAVAD